MSPARPQQRDTRPHALRGEGGLCMVGRRKQSASIWPAASRSRKCQPTICSASDLFQTQRRVTPRSRHGASPSLSLMVPAVVSTLLYGPRSGLPSRPSKMHAMRCSPDLHGVEPGREMQSRPACERMYALRAAGLNWPQARLDPGSWPGPTRCAGDSCGSVPATCARDGKGLAPGRASGLARLFPSRCRLPPDLRGLPAGTSRSWRSRRST